MKVSIRSGIFAAALLFAVSAMVVRAQDNSQTKKPLSSSQAVLENWNDIGNKLITMAQDWPEEKYTYRLNPQVRTFQEVLLHVAGSNYEFLNEVAGKKLGNDNENPNVADYKTKAETVAFLKKSVEDGAAEIKKGGNAGVTAHLDSWIGFTEHMGEHYGLLVAYYRANGVVPPASRPKK
ncbi:MAG: DinB family protein [Candidatus Acidiferrales bacterium]